jgi:hypothetical protein
MTADSPGDLRVGALSASGTLRGAVGAWTAVKQDGAHTLAETLRRRIRSSEVRMGGEG